ncbi:hypothetical protein [Ralstonia phage RP12]|uniref:Uncharacterized protein n=1 Tax=Ralstonia phage RP12 TaxID=1923889 RepID=A0A1L7N195_9CAUD|nr:hypothetical protein FDH28_gp136 [Ralstonia phage RP12]BAW19259.1 hypothetical protein [Ralstonia phage RP12]
MAIPVPTLSTQGWVTDLSSKIDFLLAHYVSTDQEQSNVYKNNISNMQYIVENYSGDPLQTAEAIARSVQTYLGRYYEQVIAEARFVLDNAVESQTTIKITLALNFTEDGISYTANRLLTYFNGKFKSITEVNNG